MSKRKDRAKALELAVAIYGTTVSGVERTEKVTIWHSDVIDSAQIYYQYIHNGKRP